MLLPLLVRIYKLKKRFLLKIMLNMKLQMAFSKYIIYRIARRARVCVCVCSFVFSSSKSLENSKTNNIGVILAEQSAPSSLKYI